MRAGAQAGATCTTLLFLLAGCGSGEPLDAGRLPLPDAARVADQAYGCPMVPEMCFRWAIVRAPAGVSAERLKALELQRLVARGWHPVAGVTRSARAANSPDGKLFASFETAREEIADERSGRVSWGSAALHARLVAAARSGEQVLAITLEKP